MSDEWAEWGGIFLFQLFINFNKKVKYYFVNKKT